MMRVLLVLALVGALVFSAFASAATLNVQGGAIQAGVDSTLYCDVDGVQVTGWGLETNDNTVRYVKIGDISSACKDNDMFVKILDRDGNELYFSGKTPVTGPEVKFNFPGPYLNPSDIEQLKVWIEGPNGL